MVGFDPARFRMPGRRKKTAMEMARGVRLLSGADIAVSTTGIAGPMGGSQYKPVGLVYIGISTKDKLLARKVNMAQGAEPSRSSIRKLAASCALYFALSESELLIYVALIHGGIAITEDVRTAVVSYCFLTRLFKFGCTAVYGSAVFD